MNRSFTGDFSRFTLYAQAGNDIAHVSSSVTVDTELFGGAGRDYLLGGGGHNLIVGGAGNDLMIGGSQRDVLIGGAGRDYIRSLGGEDLLIAARTVYDDNPRALRAIQTEWNADRSIEQRTANLRGAPSSASFGDRHNGTFFLTASGDDATVLDDGERDVLFNRRGRDLFFTDLAQGRRDVVIDLA